ncbi:TRAP transporter substrate-binding protein [Roseomonas sp. OT10]|uniref:TRAP transporter substrate-binding protein n=1 Tax=Roseomonas cutis TaxID=2897332 RepID=UPI001E40FA32|nr:TRAP transporter substrate-binding protein [Roseomonas sp. OT10]UFN47366.1 TRAP transporter substrate-binding protein [Roseomonas sp. OT10]
MKRRQLLAAGPLALAAIRTTPARAQQRTIRLATIALNNSPWHHAMMRFKEVVETESQGRLEVNLYTDGQLGDIGGLMSAMQLGTVELSYYGAPSIVQLRGAEALNIMYMPYLFRSAEWAERIQNSDEFRAIYDRIAGTAGVRLVGAWGQRSPRALQTIRGPVTRPEEVRGMRIRVAPILMLRATFERLGAQITPMGMLEIYNALSRGAIDGQDNGFDLSIPARFHEAAKFWSATDHAYELVGLFASERFWKGLSSADRELMEHAGKQTGEVTTRLTRKLDGEGVELLRNAGASYVVPDRDAFRAALAGLEQEHDGKSWPAGMAARIRRAQEAG